MGYTGGDILEITYNHPEIGSGTIFCKSNEDGTLDLGGLRTNDDANSVTGNGRFINQMNRVVASFESTIAWDMTDKDELSKINELTESPELADWTISSVSGAIWGGKGKPVGDVQGNTNTALIKLKLAFEGKLKQIA